GLLVTLRAVADSLLDDYDAVLVMDAAQDRITSDHLYELCADAREHPEAEVVVSWIQWLRRTPCWVSRAFLDRLEAHDPALTGDQVPFIRLRDHVFGEEKLAAAKAAPAAVTEFLDECSMTALEAVQLAKYAREHPGEELHSPNQPRSLMAPTKPEPLCKADARLVKAALDVLEAAEALPESERDELAWADAFGKRTKLDFPLLNDRKHADKLAYLDSAATSQRVDVALQAQYDFDAHENANVYRGAYELSAQATFTFSDARTALEDFIGAEYRQVVFTQNTSGATGLVAQAWGEHNIGEGDLVVCCLADHHSNALPFFMLAQRKGARVEYVPYDADGRLDQQAYAKLLEQRPKLVCLAHIGNVFGIMAPIKQMAAAAHEAGARVLVDAAQSFPHVAIDVNELGADWVAMSAHKAYGPMGLGALWVSPAAFAEMDPLTGGGGTVSHVGEQSYYLRPKALQYEPGTPPVSQAVGWAAAIDYMKALGMENIARHDAALTRYAVRGLKRIDGVKVMGDHSHPDGQSGLVSFTVRSVAPAETAAFLGKLGVAIRSGGHCALPLHAAMGRIGTGRISIGAYTTRDDIDAALIALVLCREAYEA
ncbi:MAG: aminotransferase class V-fold PLP-dependent enzyme, partial [Eggerthellaceae bacterium]|nr:aminotransferase class V-fold PLP-dependent enzyme [Eggerthellaceae bacterium]